jgi:hypothetical protein
MDGWEEAILVVLKIFSLAWSAWLGLVVEKRLTSFETEILYVAFLFFLLLCLFLSGFPLCLILDA